MQALLLCFSGSSLVLELSYRHSLGVAMPPKPASSLTSSVIERIATLSRADRVAHTVRLTGTADAKLRLVEAALKTQTALHKGAPRITSQWLIEQAVEEWLRGVATELDLTAKFDDIDRMFAAGARRPLG